MTYAYNTRSNSLSKWDTIQEDVADQYAYLNDEEDVQDEDEDDIFGFGKAIEIDHLSDDEVDMVLAMFGDN